MSGKVEFDAEVEGELLLAVDSGKEADLAGKLD